ncbi:MAG: hypothetical protein ACLR6J_15975 [Parabacteroides merdae]
MVETAPKVHYGEPHEVRMMAQKTGYYTEDYRKDQYRHDAPRWTSIDRFTQLFVVTRIMRDGWRYGSDERQSRRPLGILIIRNTSLPVSAITANISRHGWK